MKRDEVIDALFDGVLPATTRKEMAAKLSTSLSRRVQVHEVDAAMTHVRRNPAFYGWDIAYVKKGIPTDTDEHRYFAIQVDRDGEYMVDADPEVWRHVLRGALSTVRSHATQQANMSAAWKILGVHTRSHNKRARIADVRDDAAYNARKSLRLVDELEQDLQRA